MKELKDLVQEITTTTEELKVNLDVAINWNGGQGNKAAAARARKGTLKLAKLYKKFRSDSMDI